MSRIRITTTTERNGKENNEDAHIAIRQNERAILCVADGVGGTDAGEIASAYITKTLEAWAKDKDVNKMGKKTTHRELSSLVDRMHEDLVTISEEKHATLGSTFVLAVVGLTKVVIENVGDSRAYVCQNGCCRQVTIDQTVENYERVTGDQVDYVEEDRKSSTLMQCIGVSARVPRPVMYEEEIEEEVDILLCSDGLSNTLTEAEIQKELSKRQSGNKVLQALVSLAKERGENDNITAVLYRRRKDLPQKNQKK